MIRNENLHKESDRITDPLLMEERLAWTSFLTAIDILAWKLNQIHTKGWNVVTHRCILDVHM